VWTAAAFPLTSIYFSISQYPFAQEGCPENVCDTNTSLETIVSTPEVPINLVLLSLKKHYRKNISTKHRGNELIDKE
jgi:hypothetical protein